MIRVIRRTIRLGFYAALLGGVCFALFRLMQNRRAAHDLPPTSDWLPPRRPEKPLVEPDMLHGLSLKKPAETEAAETQLAEPELAEAQPAATDTTPSDVAESPAAWVEPEGSACPASHPIKGKLSSGIFHLPGMLAYNRTTPDRCYADESSAEADGLRKAKR